MNKIRVEQNNLFLNKENTVIEDILVNDLEINVTGNSILEMPKNIQNINLIINLQKNSKLIINWFVIMNGVKLNITINSEENSELKFNYSCKYEKDNELTLKNNILGDSTKSIIKVRSVEDNGNLIIKAEGLIKEDIKDCEYLEDIKALTENNQSIRIMPNLLVRTNSIVANHNATISNVKESDLFYLMSRGIKKENAKELVKIGFLEGILKSGGE